MLFFCFGWLSEMDFRFFFPTQICNPFRSCLLTTVKNTWKLSYSVQFYCYRDGFFIQFSCLRRSDPDTKGGHETFADGINWHTQLILHLFKVIVYLYHGKSPLNHHLGEYVLLFLSILSKSKTTTLNCLACFQPSVVGYGMKHGWYHDANEGYEIDTATC